LAVPTSDGLGEREGESGDNQKKRRISKKRENLLKKEGKNRGPLMKTATKSKRGMLGETGIKGPKGKRMKTGT